MFGNWRIGRPFGIDVFISGWFWLLPVVVFFTSFSAGGLPAAVFNTLVLLTIFGCVALHELGHALAAKWYGIRTRDITLYPIGGVARLERMPEKPSAEMVIALAGPAVNVAIAVVLGSILMLAGGIGMPTLSPSGNLVQAFILQVFYSNIVLVVFNLIPAFPMDGGRVFRSFLCWFTDRVTATNIAGWVGAGFALLIGLFGLFQLNLLLLFLAFTVFMMGRQEVMAVRIQDQHRRQQAAWEEAERDWFGQRSHWGRSTRNESDGWVYDARTGEWVDQRIHRPIR